MTPRNPIAQLPRAAAVARVRGGAGGRFLFFLALIVAALTALAPPAGGSELRLSTENDFFVESRERDDLYTFSIGIAVDRGAYTYALQEHAFTDREAGMRLDETHLTVSRRLTVAAWQVDVGGGAVHVGEGLFGESTQNAVHELIGDDEVHLRYAESEWHPTATVAAERWWPLGDRLAAGPRAELEVTPGVQSHAIFAAQLDWQAWRHLAVELLAGQRFTDADHELLARRLADEAPIGRLTLVFLRRIELSWSYNERGDEREHLTLGYRLPSTLLGWQR